MHIHLSINLQGLDGIIDIKKVFSLVYWQASVNLLVRCVDDYQNDSGS